MAHVSDACEAMPSIGESMPSLDVNSYFKVYDDMLDQLMQAGENKQLQIWSSEVERGCLPDSEEDFTIMEEGHYA